jgi:hypothetical protein
MDDSSKRRKWDKYANEGMSKEQADKFYETSIEGSKRRIDGVGGVSHYKAVVPDMDYHVKMGNARKLSDSEHKERQKNRKELVTKAIDGKKIDINRSNNTQSIK